MTISDNHKEIFLGCLKKNDKLRILLEKKKNPEKIIKAYSVFFKSLAEQLDAVSNSVKGHKIIHTTRICGPGNEAHYITLK